MTSDDQEPVGVENRFTGLNGQPAHSPAPTTDARLKIPNNNAGEMELLYLRMTIESIVVKITQDRTIILDQYRSAVEEWAIESGPYLTILLGAGRAWSVRQ